MNYGERSLSISYMFYKFLIIIEPAIALDVRIPA